MLKVWMLAAGMALAALTGGSAMAQDIVMTVGERSFTVTLEDNAYAEEFLKELPVTLSFEDFGRNERIAYLDEKLSVRSYKEAVQVKRGDLCYYVPWGNLCAFRVNYSSPGDLLRLGSMSEEALRAIEGSGSSPVTFRAVE
ncbi:MAG TPA: hypothetical protein IAB18_03195 [Candidatus Avisuccinivibrio pullicola]|nr:hypothetical protein [Candidatus Avisuccinivibrio pullicola]